jgi:hypothetical protein
MEKQQQSKLWVDSRGCPSSFFGGIAFDRHQRTFSHAHPDIQRRYRLD